MRRFYFKSAVISTLLSSNVALAGGSEQNNLGDLFGLEYPLSNLIQRTPAIDDPISFFNSMDCESFFSSAEQVIGNPEPINRLYCSESSFSSEEQVIDKPEPINRLRNFDWKPLKHLVEMTLDMEHNEAIKIIWSNMNEDQKNHFDNDSDGSKFSVCLKSFRRRIRKGNPRAETMGSHVPETLPQQMVPLIENVQLLDDILIPLPDDFLLPPLDPTTIQSDSVMANQVEPFVIDAEAMAQLNRLIDEFNLTGEVPREDTVFDWKPLQHLVEETLKKTPRYAIEIIWLQMNKEQRDHFKNNIAARSFVSGLMKQRKILRQIKNNPPVEIIENHAPEMLPQVTEPFSENGQVSEDFVLPLPVSLVLPRLDPTSVKPVFDLGTYDEVMASLNPMPEEYGSREATPVEDTVPQRFLPASQVEAPQTRESERRSMSPDSLSSRSSSDSDWETSQKIVEMDVESVKMVRPNQTQQAKGQITKSRKFKWKPWLPMIESHLDKDNADIMALIWPKMTEAQRMHYDNDPHNRRFYFAVSKQVRDLCRQKNIQPTVSKRYTKKRQFLNLTRSDNLRGDLPEMLPQLSLQAPQVEAPQTKESEGRSESLKSLSSRGSSDSDWEPSQKLVEMAVESVSMEAPMTQKSKLRKKSPEKVSSRSSSDSDWEPLQNLMETAVELRPMEAPSQVEPTSIQSDAMIGSQEEIPVIADEAIGTPHPIVAESSSHADAPQADPMLVDAESVVVCLEETLVVSDVTMGSPQPTIVSKQNTPQENTLLQDLFLDVPLVEIPVAAETKEKKESLKNARLDRSLVAFTLDMRPKEAMKIIWSNLNEDERKKFENQADGKKFCKSVANIRSQIRTVDVYRATYDWEALGHLVETTLELEPKEAMNKIWSYLNDAEKNYFREDTSKDAFYDYLLEKRRKLQMEKRSSGVTRAITLQKRTSFDWKPFESLVEQTLDWQKKDAMNLIWSHMDKTQQNHFSNKSMKSAFEDSLKHQRNLLRKKKGNPPVVNPESLN
jgi:hypothetical protein